MRTEAKGIILAVARCLAALGIFIGLSTGICFGQSSYDEYAYAILPIGGWNVLGSSSTRSLGMGETVFGNSHANIGPFNPSVLGSQTKPVLCFSGRLTDTVYRAQDLGPIDQPLISFSRNTARPTMAGVVVPLGRWTLAMGYFMFQELSFPVIDDSSSRLSVEQSGNIHGLNVSAAHRFSSWFTAGLSVSYHFGGLSRFLAREGGYDEEYDIDISGLAINFGCALEASKDLSFAFAVRVPAKINAEIFASIYYDMVDSPDETRRGKYYFQQPMVATTSLSFRPLPTFEITADLSLWNWRNISATFFTPSYGYGTNSPPNFKSTLKFNLGAECLLPLRKDKEGEAGLALRAGYIHDTQPYRFWVSPARDFLTVGLGLIFRKVEIEAAAKLTTLSAFPQRFHSDILQFGLIYRF